MIASPPTGAPVNILDDDESNIRKTLAICLEAGDNHVTAVSNFQDAVAEASRVARRRRISRTTQRSGNISSSRTP